MDGKALTGAFIAAATLAACAPTQWTKDDASADKRQEDLRACQDQAYREVIRRYSGYPSVGPALIEDSLSRRFHIYPSGPFADPFGTQLMEESRLTSACMRAKGYELAPAK